MSVSFNETAYPWCKFFLCLFRKIPRVAQFQKKNIYNRMCGMTILLSDCAIKMQLNSVYSLVFDDQAGFRTLAKKSNDLGPVWLWNIETAMKGVKFHSSRLRFPLFFSFMLFNFHRYFWRPVFYGLSSQDSAAALCFFTCYLMLLQAVGWLGNWLRVEKG